MEVNQSDKQNPAPTTSWLEKFPFKTLIWVSCILLLALLFKKEFGHLLLNAQEVKIWNESISIKVNEKELEKLEAAQLEFDNNLLFLNEKLKARDSTIQSLIALKVQMEQELKGCPRAQATSDSIYGKIEFLNEVNKQIKVRTDILNNTKIFEKTRSNHHPPSN
jgi:hypothetical protein